MSTSLASVPLEILEHIAFFTATESLVGPPSDLLPLLLTCRAIYQVLSFKANPCLYARIFGYKFDTRSVFRRLGSHVNAPQVLAIELKKRWVYLKRIRARTSSRVQYPESYQPPSLIDLLWLSYLMAIENDGKNEQQLLDYAEMDTWLMEYWFDDEGASSAARMIMQHAWPAADERNSIAMWLLWLLLRPSLVTRNVARFPRMTTIMKLTALAANHYPICQPSWAEFLPRSEAALSPSVVTHFSETYRLHPPTLAPPAILVFLTIALRILLPVQASPSGMHSLQLPADFSLTGRRSEDWDTDWYRCINLGRFDRCKTPSGAYALGSVEGVWEGVFTYTEFMAYSMLLSGAPPPVLSQCSVAHHRQTWKLREYYFAEHPDIDRDESRVLGSGDPLKAHFPSGTRIQELSDYIEVHEPGKDAVKYSRASHARSDSETVVDVIILGEGHSAWGQFNLYGRVRPLDGFISFSKEYIEGDRGRWLYRGYPVGSGNGHISGRWRDTLSPSDVLGYEGCFAMSRRG